MEKNFDPEKLNIVSFRIIKGEIAAPIDFNVDVIENYKTNMAFDVSFNVEEKIAQAEMSFDIETTSSLEQEEGSCKFNFVFVFYVENMDSLVSIVKNEIKIEEISLLISLAAISFSTSRGILLTRLQGTVLRDYILPIIDPVNLIK